MVVRIHGLQFDLLAPRPDHPSPMIAVTDSSVQRYYRPGKQSTRYVRMGDTHEHNSDMGTDCWSTTICYVHAGTKRFVGDSVPLITYYVVLCTSSNYVHMYYVQSTM